MCRFALYTRGGGGHSPLSLSEQNLQERTLFVFCLVRVNKLPREKEGDFRSRFGLKATVFIDVCVEALPSDGGHSDRYFRWELIVSYFIEHHTAVTHFLVVMLTVYG